MSSQVQSPAPRTTDYYHRAMGPFLTLEPKLVVFVESMPNAGEFFYTQTGDMNQPLLSTLMELVDYKPTMTVFGLEQLCDHGVNEFDTKCQKIQKNGARP